MVKCRNILSKQSRLPATNDPTAATAPILEQSKLPTDDPHDPTAATAPILEQPKLPTDNAYYQTATIVPVLDQATKIARPLYLPLL
jgi:hypothetical protein